MAISKTFDEIIWSANSIEDLDEILAHYLKHAPETAHQRVIEIIEGVNELVFTKQWQIDEFDKRFRRIIIEKKFRVLYQEIDNIILITRIYPTKKEQNRTY